MSRKRARECAMSLLYEAEITGGISLDTLDNMADVMKAGSLDEGNLEYLNDVAREYAAHVSEIDGRIAAHLKGWSMERVSRVDLSIMRLALIEIEYLGYPAEIVINEAVGMAKKFSTEKAGRFINGVLGGCVNH